MTTLLLVVAAVACLPYLAIVALVAWNLCLGAHAVHREANRAESTRAAR